MKEEDFLDEVIKRLPNDLFDGDPNIIIDVKITADDKTVFTMNSCMHGLLSQMSEYEEAIKKMAGPEFDASNDEFVRDFMMSQMMNCMEGEGGPNFPLLAKVHKFKRLDGLVKVITSHNLIEECENMERK